MKRTLFASALALLLLLPVALPSHADTLAMGTRLSDSLPTGIDSPDSPDIIVRYVDASATGANNGTSWVDAYTNLPSALFLSDPGTHLWIAEGVYTPGSRRSDSFVLANGVSLYGGFPRGGGDSTFAARFPAGHPTILSGEIGAPGPVDNSLHIVTGDDRANGVVLDGFTIAYGNADQAAPDNEGAGLSLNGSSVALRNCVIRDNRAVGGPPALSVSASDSFSMSDCVIELNSNAGEGSAIVLTESSATIDRTIIRNNRAGFGIGPVRLIHGNTALRNMVVVNNTNSVPSTGAITVQGGEATLEHLSVSGNNQPGLAIINFGSAGGSATFSNGILWGNDAPEIFVTPQSSLTVDSTIVQGGYADGTNVSTEDPDFVDAASGDLRLQNVSPAKNSANSDKCAAQDILGFPRPISTGCDKGAYEATDRVGVCRSPGLAIPDFDVVGISDALSLDIQGVILDVNVELDIPHESVNDLIVTLTHDDTGAMQTIMAQVGQTEEINVEVVLDDSAGAPVQQAGGPTNPAVGGVLAPANPLSIFNGTPIDSASNWTLNVSDVGGFYTGTLDRWCLSVAYIYGRVVTRTDDPAPDGCKLGDCSLREAVLDANANAGADVITFALDGTFTLALSGRNEDGAATGDLDIKDDLTIIGNGTGKTIIDGGSIDRVLHLFGGARVTISDLAIQNGLFDPVDGVDGGGGINQTENGTAYLKRTILRNNHAHASGSGAGLGGAIANGFGATMVIEDSAIHGNSADAYGAIDNTNAKLELHNSSVYGNIGNYQTIFNIAGGDNASLIIANSSIAGNSANSGSDAPYVIYSGANTSGDTASVTLQNSIISGPTVHCLTGAADGATSTITSLGNNIAGDDTCGLTDASDLPNTDPLLGPLADNGGETMTLALLDASPALDAGNDAACPAHDQRGFTRIDRDGNGDGGSDANPCDIGAYEAQTKPNTPPVANDTLVDLPGAIKPIILTGSDSDGDSLTYVVVTQPANGTLSGTPPNLSYRPNADFVGDDTFTFKVNDGTEDSAPATVTIRVGAPSASQSLTYFPLIIR